MAVILTGTEYIEVADSATMRTPSTAITIAAWVNQTSGGTSTRFTKIIGKQVNGGSSPFVSYSVGRRFAGQTHGFEVSDGGNNLIEASGTSNGQWYFIVGRWESGQADGLELLVYDTSETLVTSNSDGAPLSLTIGYDAGVARIGTNEASTPSAFYEGSIAGIYVHDARLSDAQISDLFANTISLTTDSGFTAPPITPSAGFWPLDFDARDVSGNGNDGTPVNDPAFTESPPSGVDVQVSHGLVLGHGAALEQSADIEVTHGLVLGHAAEIDSTVDTQVSHGLVLGHALQIGQTVEIAVAHGLVLGHSVDVDQSVDAAVSHGLALGHQIDVTTGAPTVQVSHGIVLGHAAAVEQTVDVAVAHGLLLGHQVDITTDVSTIQVEHGLLLGHAVAVDSTVDAEVSHGLLLGHQVNIGVAIANELQISHGLLLGHAVQVDVEIQTGRTRPIQPFTTARPLQPLAQARPIQPVT